MRCDTPTRVKSWMLQKNSARFQLIVMNHLISFADSNSVLQTNSAEAF